MAKDTIIEVRSGDIVLENTIKNVSYFEAVWGNLFDSDTQLYLNVIVPYHKIKDLTFKNDEQSIYIRATYKSVCSNFIVRLVTKNSSDLYEPLSQNIEYPAYWKPELNNTDEPLDASKLPLINIDGYYLVLLTRYNNTNFNMAMFYSAYQSDIKVGDASNQSAQLLTMCAPGSFYRFPISGVDLTKYINSIVANTDLGERLQSEFEGDSKIINDATFDSYDGNLDLSFSDNNEETNGTLTPVDELDVELLKVADDKFVETLLQEEAGEIDSNSIIAEFSSFSNVVGTFFFHGTNAERKPYESLSLNSKYDEDGALIQDSKYWIVNISVSAGTILFFNLPSNYEKEPVPPILFKLLDGEETVLYMPTPYEYLGEMNGGSYKVGAIVLRDSIMSYVVRGSAYARGEGVYVVNNIKDALNNFLVITHNKITSRLMGYVTTNSTIKNVKLDTATGKIWVLK